MGRDSEKGVLRAEQSKSSSSKPEEDTQNKLKSVLNLLVRC